MNAPRHGFVKSQKRPGVCFVEKDGIISVQAPATKAVVDDEKLLLAIRAARERFFEVYLGTDGSVQ